MAIMHICKVNLLYRSICAIQCGLQIRTGAGDTEHPAAAGEVDVPVSLGTRVMTCSTCSLASCIQALDRISRFILDRIAATRKNDTGGTLFRPFNGNLIKGLVISGLHDGEKIRLQ